VSVVFDRQTAAAVSHVLTQVVRYAYSSPVTDLCQRLVVMPPEIHGGQRRIRHSFAVAGADDATWVTRADRWGNTVIDVQVPVVDAAIEFVIEAVTVSDRLEHAMSSAGRFVPATRLTAAPVIGPLADLAGAAADADPAGICSLVHASLEYRTGITGVRTTAAEAAAGGVGVCQDFAHVMLAVCRAVGLPARYVSGHLAGEGASHAWVETLTPVKIGRRTGFTVEAWDPTHDRRTDSRYLTVATGRDYADVAPLSGTFEADNLVDTDLIVTKSLTVEPEPAPA
jgi:transglutaminase-like putative cysteine protease